MRSMLVARPSPRGLWRRPSGRPIHHWTTASWPSKNSVRQDAKQPPRRAAGPRPALPADGASRSTAIIPGEASRTVKRSNTPPGRSAAVGALRASGREAACHRQILALHQTHDHVAGVGSIRIRSSVIPGEDSSPPCAEDMPGSAPGPHRTPRIGPGAPQSGFTPPRNPLAPGARPERPERRLGPLQRPNEETGSASGAGRTEIGNWPGRGSPLAVVCPRSQQRRTLEDREPTRGCGIAGRPAYAGTLDSSRRRSIRSSRTPWSSRR